MAWGYTDWDSDTGLFRPGTIRRASSSDSKVWGEENRTDNDLDYGTFVAINPEGGIRKIEKATDLIHGVVVRDIYGDKAPHNKQVNVGHFSHGDSIAVAVVERDDFTRGDKAYIVATGKEAGKVTKTAKGNIDLGYWVEDVSTGNHCVSVTLGYIQNVQTGE
jgi:hypothetical protein